MGKLNTYSSSSSEEYFVKNKIKNINKHWAVQIYFAWENGAQC